MGTADDTTHEKHHKETMKEDWRHSCQFSEESEGWER